MRLEEVAATSRAVSATRSRRAKVGLLAACLGRLEPREARVGTAYLAGELPQGRIGVGWATVRSVEATPADEPSLTLLEVDATLQRIADTTGSGSQTTREGLLRDLLARATAEEQAFVRALLLQELRQGALEGVLVEAVAVASGAAPDAVRRAVMLAGDVTAVATAALDDGAAGLARFRLSVLDPVKPMLAQTAETLEEALGRVGDPAVEFKFDGARLQVHRSGGEVRLFTRSLRDVTADLPGVAATVEGLPVRQVVLDGEAIGLGADGRPLPFQETMRRFGGGGGLRLFVFDCLHLDGDDLLDRPTRDRFAAVRAAAPDLLVPRRESPDPEAAVAVLDDAVARGHEGVMVKDLDAPYEAGRRGAAWLKVKPTHTLDLVVLAAEWGSGRRRGWLSNLHLGARDPVTSGFVMLGKTFKGLSDELLTWQTEQLLAREVRREGHVVHVRPELVVEIAFDGVQRSTRYPGGVALRFARVKGYRTDKSPEEADTLDAVRAVGGG